MKVNDAARSRQDPLVSFNKPPGTDGAKFSQMVSRQGQLMHKEQIDRLLAEVQSAGERLGKSRNFQDLAKYKTLVKRLLKETVDEGMKLKQSHNWNQFAEGKVFQTVEMIDRKLVELTEDVLDKEKQSIDLLDRIGEIKGLLIHLYI